MSLDFYKPNAKNTGCAVSVAFNAKEECAFFELIRQVGEGKFSGGKKIKTKLGLHEIAGIILALEKGTEFKGYHERPNSSIVTLINFGPYYADKNDKSTFRGFSLSILKKDKENSETGDERFLIGFTPPEGRLLKEYLTYALSHCFDANYSADKQRYKEALQRNSQNNQEADAAAAKQAKMTAKKTELPVKDGNAAPPETDPFLSEELEEAGKPDPLQ